MGITSIGQDILDAVAAGHPLKADGALDRGQGSPPVVARLRCRVEDVPPPAERGRGAAPRKRKLHRIPEQDAVTSDFEFGANLNNAICGDAE